jgi:hypothetical protein
MGKNHTTQILHRASHTTRSGTWAPHNTQVPNIAPPLRVYIPAAVLNGTLLNLSGQGVCELLWSLFGNKSTVNIEHNPACYYQIEVK